ncbi:MAG: SHD1 domain-containing protein, partial [Aureliella sp.]
MWPVRSTLLALLLVFGLGAPQRAGAAEKYTSDEDVEVLFLNSWIPAKVRDFNKKGEVLAEFTFANRPKTQVFPPEKVRRPYESGSIARGRLWSDATGQFKVKAALLKIRDGKVELRTEDMKEVSVSIDKLSPKDQTFLKQFQKQAGIAALPVPALPTVTEFDTQHASSSEGFSRKFAFHQDAKTESTVLHLDADPIRKGLELTQAGTGFPTDSHLEKLSSLIALGGADNWVLASIGEGESQPTRLLWVALAKGAVKKIQMLPAGEMLMDYHAGSRQMLTYSKRAVSEQDQNEHPVLTVWQTDPSTEEPQAVVSWNARLPGDNSWHHSVPWVRFASATHIVQRTETHRIMAWDIAERRLAWSTPQESFFAPEPQLSAGGKYVYVPEDGGLRIVDSATGKTLDQVPMNGCTGVGVHADGRKIAVANRNDIFIVDVTGAEPTGRLNVASAGSPFSMKIDWVTDKLLCIDSNTMLGMVLYSLEHELPIWTYTFDPNAY